MMQNVLGYSALQTGFAFLPLGVGVVVTAQVMSRVVGRIGTGTPIALGALAVGVGLLWLSRISVHAAYVPALLGPLVTLSIGFGSIFFPTTLVAVSGAARRESGLASALLNVSQQLGGSIGLAVLGTIAANASASHLMNVRPTPELVREAITAGFTTAFLAGSLVAAAGFVLAIVVIRARRPQRPAAEPLPEAA
jgi:predicted MFS family arabinose efflux permease